jgi:hypothetical protein
MTCARHERRNGNALLRTNPDGARRRATKLAISHYHATPHWRCGGIEPPDPCEADEWPTTTTS